MDGLVVLLMLMEEFALMYTENKRSNVILDRLPPSEVIAELITKVKNDALKPNATLLDIVVNILIMHSLTHYIQSCRDKMSAKQAEKN